MNQPPPEDFALDEQGRRVPVAPGEASAASERIVSDPQSTPVLVIAMRNGEIGVRVFKPITPEIIAAIEQVLVGLKSFV
jgi:hypothetical protein